MKNLKIKWKLIVSYIIALCSLIVVTAFVTLAMNNISTQTNEFYDGPFVLTASIRNIRINFEVMQKSIFRATTTVNKNDTELYVQNATDAMNAIDQEMMLIKESYNAGDDKVEQLQILLDKHKPMFEDVCKMALTNENSAALAFIASNNIPLLEESMLLMDELTSYSDDEALSVIEGIQSVQSLSLPIVCAIALVGAIFCVIVASYIIKSITRPIKMCVKRLDELAKGDLKTPVPDVNTKDEIGLLVASTKSIVSTLSNIINDLDNGLDAMSKGDFTVTSADDSIYLGDFISLHSSYYKIAQDMSTTLSQIDIAANQVSSGSDQMSSSAQALAQGTTEQASSIEELAATINEITQKINSTNDNSKSAQDATKKAVDAVTVGTEQMQRMTEAMNDIDEKSKEISKIIKAIDDIAFQTNILSLNAAVEAARAGSAGKGFAVVAEEVRNLAAKSAQSAKDTASLIEGTVAVIEAGNKIAEETAESINLIGTVADEVGNLVTNISISANEQAISIMQINQGVDQISSVVQTNSATAEESAATSEELSSQSQILRNLTSRFNILKNTNNRFDFEKKPVLNDDLNISLEDEKY